MSGLIRLYGDEMGHCPRCGGMELVNFDHICPTPSKPEQPKHDITNPKDLLGSKKVPLGLLPAAGKIYGAMAMKNGADKYGPYNWREKKVRITIYLDAIERHLLALRDGEDKDRESGLPHLAHIIASASIIADAVEGGFAMDDRPKPGPAADVMALANAKL